MPETTTPTRRALHAFLSDGAHDAWHDYAATNGVSVSGLLEVFGEALHDGVRSIKMGDLIQQARIVDAGRRRRVGINRKS